MSLLWPLRIAVLGKFFFEMSLCGVDCGGRQDRICELCAGRAVDRHRCAVEAEEGWRREESLVWFGLVWFDLAWVALLCSCRPGALDRGTAGPRASTAMIARRIAVLGCTSRVQLNRIQCRLQRWPRARDRPLAGQRSLEYTAATAQDDVSIYTGSV